MTGAVTGGISRRGVLRAGGMAAGAAVMAATRPGRARAQGAAAKTLRYGLSSYPPNLRPWESTGSAAGTVKMMLHRGLVGYDAAGKLAPELAESWKADETSYTFVLRAGAKFHNGDPVTSADVKHSLEAITAANSTAYLRADLGIVASIETPDARTIRLVLKHPSATLPYILAGYNGAIVSTKSTPDNIIGAGPYTLGALERGTRVRVERFDGFYKKDRPRMAAIDFIAYADENLRVAALQSGDVDIIEYVPAASMDTIESNKALALQGTSGPFMDLLFNVTKPPFNDPRVRQALGFAVNSEDIVKAAFNGKGAPLYQMPVPEGTLFSKPVDGGHWSFNPERAKQLLSAAGFGGGITCGLLSTAQYSMHKDTASVLQQQLAAVGVQTTLSLPDWPTRVLVGGRGQYELAIHGTSGDYNDPDSLTPLIGSGPNTYARSYGFKSDRIQSLLEQGRGELDTGKRVAIYDQLKQAFFDEVPLLPLCWRTQAYAAQAKVRDFSVLPGFLTFLSYYSLDDVTLA